ncbi:hypothetical protein ElP_21520 [Tautonia plasticadhaerens]|uniref:Uncharacterized protein n=1 Tax=Tautonia plasticadhaerens TaxID=2527974 RepID=A0A518H097_9BACT|nr:hypothetical protein ElP_21520 [Tautonia plasticadhaerens]
MKVACKAFRIEWDDEPNFDAATNFTEQLAPEQLISISHSNSHVVVWYWEREQKSRSDAEV